MSSAPVDPLIGQTLDGRYVVRSKIARGGMAMVYRGDDLRLGRSVAIKIMHAHLADDENFTRRFEQEARSAAGLGHPNVVNVFDQGEASGVPYLVMEHLPGITLRELLKQQRQLSPEEAGEISEAVLAGLAAAHEAGIVHRDLKPENVLLADDGRIKIGDFGLARAVSANTTTGQALLGTIAYLSPELVTRGIADARSDLYAFGIMLFEMLTGKQPYTGEQPMQIAYQHAHSDVPLPSSVAPEVPPEFDRLVQWTTQRDADARPGDAREALEYMRALHAGGASAATAVLPATASFGTITPSTAVLGDLDRQALAEGVQTPAGSIAGAPPRAVPAMGAASERAHDQGAKRTRRGRWTAAILTLLLAVAGGAGWWWGQGPGASVPIPSVTGMEMAAAQQTLEEASLVVEPFECSSLKVEQGLAVRTEPKAGTRVERGSAVRLCQSTGPEMLAVPALVGLPLEQAKTEIGQARFVFGSVVAERFDGGEKGVVILALDSAGDGLGETYPEQGVIDLIVSAGSVPSVEGLSVEAATKALNDAGLEVDAEAATEAHHDSVEAGRVIGIVTDIETLSVGDAVGLQVSLGPELFEVPEVEDLPLQEAMDLLESAGFEPTTNVPDALRGFAVATGTNPKAGERLKKGSTVQVKAKIEV